MSEDQKVKFNEAVRLLTEIRDFYGNEVASKTMEAIENLLQEIEND